MKKLLVLLCLMISFTSLASESFRTAASDLLQSTQQFSNQVNTVYQTGTPWNSSQVQTAQSLFDNVGISLQKLATYQSQMNSSQAVEFQEMANKYSSMNDSVESMSTLTGNQMSTLNGQAIDLEGAAANIEGSILN